MDWYSFFFYHSEWSSSFARTNFPRSNRDTPRVLLTFSFPSLPFRMIFSPSPFSPVRTNIHPPDECRPSQRFLRPAESSYHRRSLVAERQRWWRRRRHERQRHIHAAEDSSFARRSVFSGLNGVYLFPLFLIVLHRATSSIMSTRLYSGPPALVQESLLLLRLPPVLVSFIRRFVRDASPIDILSPDSTSGR